MENNPPINSNQLMPKILQNHAAVAEYHQIVSATENAIFWICVFQGFDAARLILGGALRGAKDFNVNCLSTLALLMEVTYFLGSELVKKDGYEIKGVVLARGIAVAATAIITTAWWIYKSLPGNYDKTISKTISNALVSTGLFKCCKRSINQETREKYEEGTQLLRERVDNINGDPDHRKFWPNMDPESGFQPAPRTCLIL